MSYLDLCEICATAKNVAADLCDQALTSESQLARRTTDGATGEPVTSADLDGAASAVRLLQHRWPDDTIVVEGRRTAVGAQERIWVVDPLDGTANWAAGHTYWAAAVACITKAGLTAGAVHGPPGAWLACSRCTRSSGQRHQKPEAGRISLLGVPPPLLVSEDSQRRLAELLHRCGESRILGAASLDICAVADGTAGIYFEEQLAWWDWAAACAVAINAGGKVCLWPQPPDRWAVLVHTGEAQSMEIESLLREWLGHPLSVVDGHGEAFAILKSGL